MSRSHEPEPQPDTQAKKAARARRPGAKKADSKAKSGRPKGSIRKLTDEERAQLLSAIEGGATPHAAAMGLKLMDARTFRRHRAIAESDEGHLETGYLIELFIDIDAASARSRIRRELEVASNNPLPWLRNQARSEPGLPGWTTPIPEEAAEESAGIYAPTPEELAITIRILIESGAVPNPFTKEEADGEEEHDQEPST